MELQTSQQQSKEMTISIPPRLPNSTITNYMITRSDVR